MGDKLFDTIPFAVLAIFAIAYLMFYLHLSTTLFILLLIALVIFIVLLAFIIYICINETVGILTIEWIFRQLRRFISKDLDKYEEKTKSSLIGFQNSLRYIMNDRKLLILATVISFLVWFLELLRVYVVFLAFGVHVSLWYDCSSIPRFNINWNNSCIAGRIGFYRWCNDSLVFNGRSCSISQYCSYID